MTTDNIYHSIQIYQRRLRSRRSQNEGSGAGHFFNPLVEDLGATLDAIRASLPDFVNQLHYYGDDDNIWDDVGEERRLDTPRPAGEDNNVNIDLVQRLVCLIVSLTLLASFRPCLIDQHCIGHHISLGAFGVGIFVYVAGLRR